ncbi:MAG: efflux transporter periplasmic adaptor subunit, partial [Mangrovicoccus sp.]
VLEVAGLDLVAPGVILRESPVVAEGQTGRQIFARIDQPAGFRPGDFVTVRVQEPRLARAARLPAQAYGADGTVLVVGEGERLQSAAVELLRRQDNEVLILAENLEGRQIVAERTPLLGDGIKIKPVARDGSTPKAEAMLALSQERRARLIAFVEGNSRLPDEVKTRMLGQLRQEQVPAEMVERLEQRMGS